MEYELPILPTSVIGSYPRPKWLREMIKAYKRKRISGEDLKEAYDDAVVTVVADQERAGVDIPSDGEQRRDEMVEFFAERIGGFKFYDPVRVWGNAYYKKPAVIGPLEYKGPMIVDEYKFLRTVSSRKIVKMTITGPYTIAEWSFNEYYSSKEELTFELAKIINKELKALQDAGNIFIQIDEPALPTHENEIHWAVQAVNKAIEGLRMKIGLHVCYGEYKRLIPYFDELMVSQFALEFANRNFKELDILNKIHSSGKEIGFGVIDVHNKKIENIDDVANAIRKAVEIMGPYHVYVNPDCGLKLQPRSIAYQKLVVMTKATEIVRKELKAKGYEKNYIKI